MIRVSCPKCKAILQVEDKHAGQVIACSNCKTSLRLPPAPSAPPPPVPAIPVITVTADWHYSKGGQKHGPLTEAQLQKLAASGELLRTDMVWKQGMNAWVQAGTVQGLFNGPSPPPMPVAISDSVEDSKLQLWSRLWANKLLFFSLCLSLSLVLTCIAGSLFGGDGIHRPSPASEFFAFFFLFLDLGLFVTVVVLAFLRVGRSAWWMQQGLVGRWVPVDANDQELVFSKTTITQGKSLLGTFTISSDKKRIVISANGSIVETWTVESLDVGEFVVTTQQNVTKCYKRYNPLGNLFTITPEDKKRWRLLELQHKWEPVDGNGPAIQFTEDGAMIRFDGFAARYTHSGEQPNEAITIHVNDKDSIELKVLSLSRDEMVLTGEGGSVHYKRGVSISAAEAKRRSDAFNEKLKAVGKGALLTVGAIGAGIAILGVAAAAGAAAGGTGVGGGDDVNSGLVRCTSCGGQGVNRYTQNMGTNMVEYRCSVCDGKGWVKR